MYFSWPSVYIYPVIDTVTQEKMNPLIAQENLTAMEAKVLDSLISMLYAEEGFSDVDANDLSQDTGIPTRKIRGVLSSLVQKGYVFIDDPGAGFQIVYLANEKYHLHPEWSKK
jgi:hypothetical protein